MIEDHEITVGDLENVDEQSEMLQKGIGYVILNDLIHCTDELVPMFNSAEKVLEKAFDTNDVPIYTYDLDKFAKSQKDHLINFIINNQQKSYPSLKLNPGKLMRFAYCLHPFNVETFLKFINCEYEDVDLLTVQQLQSSIIYDIVGYHRTGDTITVKDYTDTGITYDVSLYQYSPLHYINNIIKFAQMVLSDISPTKITGLSTAEVGESYSDMKIKSIKVFKKGTIKIRFDSAESKDMFIKALNKPAWELLGRGEAHELVGVPLQICDTCMVKNILCGSCEHNSLWIGNCNYCATKNHYPKNHCVKCRPGHADNFNLVSDIEKTPELKMFLDTMKRSWC